MKEDILERTFFAEKAGKDMTVEIRIAEACGSFKATNRESFPYIMHIVDEPRKFPPSNVLTYTVKFISKHLLLTSL